MTNAKERILYFIESQQINKEYFFEKVGLSYSNFKGIQKKSGLNTDAIVKILSIYPELNVEWLITGNGEMLKGYSEKNKIEEPPAVYQLEKSNEVLAQKKTIEILESVVEDLRDDKRVLKNIIENNQGNAKLG
jgi:hypothetical protein